MEESTDQGAHASSISDYADTCEVRSKSKSARKTDRANLPRLSYRVDEACELTSLGRTSLYDRFGDGSVIARKCRNCTIILAEELFRESNPEPYPVPYLSMKEVSEVTGIGRATIYKFKDRELPFEGFGRRELIKVSVLLTWLRSLPEGSWKRPRHHEAAPRWNAPC
jgi:excisionase family DNA binding protein